MKKLYNKYENEQEAIQAVKGLLENGTSAYRQGLNVFVDDGGYDWGL